MHGVNCRGVMGAGFALEVKNRFPVAFATYQERCRDRTPEMLLGTSLITPINSELTIMHCFTQKDYGSSGKYVSYDAFESSLYALPSALHGVVKELHFPMIGAGLGGGKWEVMAAIIDTHYATQKGLMKYLWVQ